MLNDLGIADGILGAGFNEHGWYQDETLEIVVGNCRKSNLELNKDIYLFMYVNIPFFGNIISWEGASPDLSKIQILTDMLLPKKKKEVSHSWVH